MKVYISADIEGVTGVTHGNEGNMEKAESNEFREQMTAEVAAACEGALKAGATEIWVKDAHGSGRNILAAKLPQEVRLVRGWSGHPFMMVAELDGTFDAAMMVGYHSRGGSATSPLAHTLTGRTQHIKINDRYASEFLLNGYTAAMLKVPVAFVSGDKGICDEAVEVNPRIRTAAVKTGIGNSTVSVHPKLATTMIQEGVAAALAGNLTKCQIPLPSHFSVEMLYRNPADAYKAAFYPGVTLKEPSTILYGTDSYMEVLRLLFFLLLFNM